MREKGFESWRPEPSQQTGAAAVRCSLSSTNYVEQLLLTDCDTLDMM